MSLAQMGAQSVDDYGCLVSRKLEPDTSISQAISDLETATDNEKPDTIPPLTGWYLNEVLIKEESNVEPSLPTDREARMSDPKEGNPKQAIGTKKAPMSTVSSVVLMELGVAMLSGAVKYGRHNYRVAGARASTYFDAFNRHTKAWWEGEDIDPDSGEPHLMMAMGCIAVLRDAQIHGVETDDRPPKSPKGWLEELNRRAAAILEQYPDPVAAYTELGRECSEIEGAR